VFSASAADAAQSRTRSHWLATLGERTRVVTGLVTALLSGSSDPSFTAVSLPQPGRWKTAAPSLLDELKAEEVSLHPTTPERGERRIVPLGVDSVREWAKVEQQRFGVRVRDDRECAGVVAPQAVARL